MVFENVQQVCQGSLKGVSRKFQECFKEVLRVFQKSFKCISWKNEGWLKGVFSVVQGCLK